MSDLAKIRCPGGLADYLVIERAHGGCGEVEDGISVRFDGTGGAISGDEWSSPHKVGFVLSWPDFEAAYLAIKAAREVEVEPAGEYGLSRTVAGQSEGDK